MTYTVAFDTFAGLVVALAMVKSIGTPRRTRAPAWAMIVVGYLGVRLLLAARRARR